MAKGELFPSPKVGAHFAPFEFWTRVLVLGTALAIGSQLREQDDELSSHWLTGDRAGDIGGETKVGVGSSVDNAAALVSPLSSPPRLLDFRRARGMLSLSCFLPLVSVLGEERLWIYAAAREWVLADMADSTVQRRFNSKSEAANQRVNDNSQTLGEAERTSRNRDAAASGRKTKRLSPFMVYCAISNNRRHFECDT